MITCALIPARIPMAATFSQYTPLSVACVKVGKLLVARSNCSSVPTGGWIATGPGGGVT